jgi:hypothetical protein
VEELKDYDAATFQTLLSRYPRSELAVSARWMLETEKRERAGIHEPRRRFHQGRKGPSGRSLQHAVPEEWTVRSAQAVKVVEVRVNGLILEHKSQQNIVILRESEGERILPFWIGPGEAQAIRRILSDESFPRPLTHDLTFLIAEGLKARIARS